MKNKHSEAALEKAWLSSRSRVKEEVAVSLLAVWEEAHQLLSQIKVPAGSSIEAVQKVEAHRKLVQSIHCACLINDQWTIVYLINQATSDGRRDSSYHAHEP